MAVTRNRHFRRVLILITSLDAGGAQRHVRDLLATRPHGIEFQLAGGTPGWLAREASRLGVPVHLVDLSRTVRPWSDVRAYGQIHSLFRQVEPDLVHVHSTKAAFLGRLGASRMGIPVVYTAHGWPFQTGLRGAEAVLSLLAEYALRNVAAKVITVSRRDADVARRLGIVHPRRLVVIENGIDPSAYSWHPGPYGRRLIYMGRLEPAKGVDHLLRALAGVRHLSWTLTVWGTGSLASRFHSMAHGLGLEDRVRFAGWADDPRTALEEADCLVLPSDKEGLPYAALEALASGLFLIVTEVGALSDLRLRQVMRVPPRNVKALQDALEVFLTRGWRDPAYRPHRDEVDSLFRERFGLARMVGDLVSLYHQVLTKERG